MTAFVIPSNSKFLLGFLNSSLVQNYISKTSPEIRGGYFRWKKQYVSSIPFPFSSLDELPNKVRKDIEKVVESILSGKLSDVKKTEAKLLIDELVDLELVDTL